jgi:hypothetical protein
MDIVVALVMIDINKELGGVADARHCHKGMPVAQNRKISDCMQFEKKRAGDFKKIPNHQVVGPGEQKIRKAIKDVINPLPLLADDAVDPGRKRFEAFRGIQAVYHDVFGALQQRLMMGKAYIDNFLLLLAGLFHKRKNNPLIIVEGIQLPDDIVPSCKPVIT